MATFWVAFTDQGGEPLGVAIVEAADDANDLAVVERTFALNINPGRGSITVRRIRDEDVPGHMRNRLLTKDEIAEFIGFGQS